MCTSHPAMIAIRLLHRILAEVLSRGFLVWHRWATVLAYLVSPYGWFATPARRLRQLDRTPTDLPAFASATRSAAIASGGEAGICILALYATQLSESSWLSIHHWTDLGFRVVVVNNASLLPADQERLRGLAWHVFERVNIGQDIGAFKDVILWLEAQGHLSQCPVLAISNDSLQWIPGANACNLKQQTLEFLGQGQQEALFSHCSYQICRHYQSFFQVLKPAVFRSRRFLDFWQRYQPIGNRQHCVLKGELGLSKQIYNDLSNVSLLYSTEKLLQTLMSRLDAGRDVAADELLFWMPSVYRTHLLRIKNPALDVLLHAADQQRSLRPLELASVADLIENNNPTHVAAFLYPLYLFCPFVKKELCFAGSFTLAQAIVLYRKILMTSYGSENQSDPLLIRLCDEYAQALYAKGIPFGYQVSRREALRKGLKTGFVYLPTFAF
jgi:Rhamnan synthesis protein F